jgi:hypothetical protein
MLGEKILLVSVADPDTDTDWIRVCKGVPRSGSRRIKNDPQKYVHKFLVIKTLDPDPDSLEMLDPDPDSMNLDPQHCYWVCTRKWNLSLLSKYREIGDYSMSQTGVRKKMFITGEPRGYLIKGAQV